MISAIIDTGLKILDKVIPDPEMREKAKIELLRQEQAGQLRELEVAMSAIIAEAKSTDKWTSRARPSFMYVMYVLFLSAIPMGVLFAYNPEVASAITLGFKGWLEAIPEPITTLFSVGYLGYTGARSFDKYKSNK